MAADYHLAIWTLLAVLAVASTQNTSPSPECSLAIGACTQDYSSKASSVTSLDQFCGVLDDYTKCLLKQDACNQSMDYIRNEVIPAAYNIAKSQGSNCQAPVFTTQAPVKPVTSKDATTTSKASVQASTTRAPVSQACSSGISSCMSVYSSKASSVTDPQEYCGLLEEASECVLKIDACDEKYLREEVIPYAYNAAQEQGVYCVQPVQPGHSQGNKTSHSSSTTPKPQDCFSGISTCQNEMASKMASMAVPNIDQICGYLEGLAKCYLDLKQCDPTYIRDTLIPMTYDAYRQQNINCTFKHAATTHASPCESDAKKCHDIFVSKIPYTSYSDYCRLVYNYRSCMWDIWSCDRSYVYDQIEDLVGDNLRDCDKDAQPSGQAGVRSQMWVLGLILCALPCLIKALFAWN